MAHELFEVMLPAIPLPGHHRYYDLQGAWLQVLLMAQSADEALERAEAMLPLLLWEGVESTPDLPVTVTQLAWPRPPEESAPSLLQMQTARDIGFLVLPIVWPTGASTGLPNNAPPVD